MVRKLILLLLVLTVMMFLSGCGVAQRKIMKTVKASLQKNLSSDPQYIEYNLKVTDFKVEKTDKGTYQGLAKIDYKGELHEVPVKIEIDGSNITWDIDPGSFAFLPR